MRRDFAEDYSGLENWHWWFEGRREIIGHVLRRISEDSQARYLASLGSGPVSGMRWLKAFVGPAGWVVGVDADPSGVLRESRADDGPPEDRVRLVIGQAERPPLSARSWDIVLALDLLEHLDDDAAGLREIGKLVRVGGTLLVTVPALPSLWGNQDIVAQHRRRYSRRSLREAFARAGLPSPRVTYFNTLLLPIIAPIRWARRLTGRVRAARSDFECNRAGMVNTLLARVFGVEKHLVFWPSLPVGVSLMASCRLDRRSSESCHPVSSEASSAGVSSDA